MKKILLIALITLSSLSIVAQKQANFWYFGTYAGLSFGLGLPIAVLDGQLSTWEGCSSISTDQGNLLFYTDGMTVWNKNHLVMPNGTDLHGHVSSTQSGVIVPHPTNTNIYYIFTVDYEAHANGMKYTAVDMSLSGGLGDVVTSEKNISLLAPTCEKITAVGHSDGNSFWVMGHQWGSNSFYAWRITGSGVNTTPVISNVGAWVGGDSEYSKGYMKASPDGSKIAVAHNTMNMVEIFDFNNTSGVISNPITDNTYLGGQGGPYGVEFSPNSELLYIAEWKDNSKIHQYDLTAGTPQAILDSRTVVATVSQNGDPIGGLQLGPDNRLYCAKSGSEYLGVITHPNTVGTGCNYVSDGVYLGGRTSYYGLPPFIQSFFTLNVEFYYDPPCYQIPTQFYLTASDNPDSVLWDFGDPASGNNSSTLLNPIHQFSGPGLYLVTVQAWISGHNANAFHLVIVKGPPEASLTADQISIPYNTFTTLHGVIESGDNCSFEWIPEEKLLNPDTLDPQTTNLLESTAFTLIVTDTMTGCADIQEITIMVTGSPLGVSASANPMSICRGESSQLNALGSGGTGTYTYQWSSDPAGFNSDLQNPVVYPDETTEYTVMINDGYNNAYGSVTVTVDPDVSSNAGDDQLIPYGTSTYLNGSSSAGSNAEYYWEPENKVTNPFTASPSTVDLTQNTMFTLRTTDGVTGCYSIKDTVFVNIEGGPLTVSAFVDNNEVCQGTEITLTASPSGGNPENYEYSWSDNYGYNYASQPVISAVPNVSTTYYATVTDGFTTEQAEVFVQVNPGPAFTINSGSDTIMACPYDTIMLECLPHNDDWSYYWSNGAVTPFIKTGSTGIGYDIKQYTLTVQSSSNCIIEKDVVVIFDFSYCFGIGEHDGRGPVSIYPNPASDMIHIRIEGEQENVTLSIYDMSGKLVAGNKEYSSSNGQLEIEYSTRHLEEGIYLIKMIAEDKVYCNKLILAR